MGRTISAAQIKKAESVLNQRDASYFEVVDAEKLLDSARMEEEQAIQHGEVGLTEAHFYSSEQVWNIRRNYARSVRSHSLMSPVKAKELDWTNPMEWREADFFVGQTAYFSHRIDLEYLTPDQESALRVWLEKHHIAVEERKASAEDGVVRKGDRTLRVRDVESIRRLRRQFGWAEGAHSRPVTKSLEDYKNPKAANKEVAPEKRESVTPVLQTEDEKDLHWTNSRRWHSVGVPGGKDKIVLGHRLCLEGLSTEEQKEILDGLAKQGIEFSVRTATAGSLKGKLTVRIGTEEAVKNLRRNVFHWAEGSNSRPVTMTYAEYAAYCNRKSDEPVAPEQKQSSGIKNGIQTAENAQKAAIIGEVAGHKLD